MGVGIKSTKIKYEIIVELSALAKKVDNQLISFSYEISNQKAMCC